MTTVRKDRLILDVELAVKAGLAAGVASAIGLFILLSVPWLFAGLAGAVTFFGTLSAVRAVQRSINSEPSAKLPHRS